MLANMLNELYAQVKANSAKSSHLASVSNNLLIKSDVLV